MAEIEKPSKLDNDIKNSENEIKEKEGEIDFSKSFNKTYRKLAEDKNADASKFKEYINSDLDKEIDRKNKTIEALEKDLGDKPDLTDNHVKAKIAKLDRQKLDLKTLNNLKVDAKTRNIAKGHRCSNKGHHKVKRQTLKYRWERGGDLRLKNSKFETADRIAKIRQPEP